MISYGITLPKVIQVIKTVSYIDENNQRHFKIF